MDPKRIYMYNFMSHSETEIDCTQFNSCLIVGRSTNDDRESNGTGKSTIFHAINFVLFGIYPTKKIDFIVRDGQDNCIVEFDFELDGVDYRAVRKRSVKSNTSEFLLKHWTGSKWENPDTRKKSTLENRMKELIKINYDAFKNSVLFAQNSLSEIAEGTDTQRRKILKEPLSLSVYTQLEKLAKNRYTIQEKELDKVKTIIGELGNPDYDIVNITEELKNLNSLIEGLEQKRKATRYDISELRNKLSDKEKLLSSDAAKIADKLVALDDEKRKIDNQLTSFENKATSYSQDLKKKREELIKLNDFLSKKSKELNDLQSSYTRTEQQVADDLAKLDDKEERGVKYVASLEDKYERWSKPLPEGSQCEECFNELTDEYRLQVSHDNCEKAKKVQEDLKLANEKMSKLRQKKKALYAETKEIYQRQKRVAALTEQISSVNASIKSQEEYVQKIEALSQELIVSVDAAEKEKKSIEERESELKNSSRDFSISKINDEIVSLTSSIKSKELEENKIIEDISSNSTLIGINEERKRKRESDSVKLAERQKEQTELERKVRIHSRVVKAFSSSGIPTLIIHTILDDLQIEANNILQDIRPDISLSFSIENEDKDVLEINYQVNGRDREYHQLSGGQKTFVAFALKLGLSLVIQKRLGVSIKFLEFDEVDQPLDQAGQDAYVDIIRKYQSKFKIFVVTHNDRLKDKFNHAILVENDGNNGSTGKLVTQW